MPRKREITKDMIVDAGFEIVKNDGYTQLSARNIAKNLNCSTQPIYYYFDNIEKVEIEVMKKAYGVMIHEYMKKQTGEDAFLQTGLGYIEFARSQSNLFEYLYFSRRNKGIDKKSYSQILSTAKQGEKMGDVKDKTLERIQEKISLFTHGVAVTLMNNPDAYTKDEVRTMLIETAQSISAFERNLYEK